MLPESRVAAQREIMQYFATSYAKLSTGERDTFCADLLEMAHLEHLTLSDAARIMYRRIGGQKNLRPYVASLMAGVR